MKIEEFIKIAEKKAKEGDRRIELEFEPKRIRISMRTISALVDHMLWLYPQTNKIKAKFRKNVISHVEARVKNYGCSNKFLTGDELVRMIEFMASKEEIRILNKKLNDKGE